MKFYSAKTGGFYSEEVHGDRQREVVITDPESGEVINRYMELNPDCKIPGDAVEVTDEEHVRLIDGQADSGGIVPDKNGYPILASVPEPSIAQLGAEARLDRNARLTECDFVVTAAYERGEPVPAEWVSYRQALRDLPNQKGFPSTINWPVKP